MSTLIYIVSFIFGSAGLVTGFCYVLFKKTKIWVGILIAWGLSVIAVFVVAVVFPWIACLFGKQELVPFFPEATGVIAVIYLGWFSSSIVCVLAGIIRALIRRFLPNQVSK